MFDQRLLESFLEKLFNAKCFEVDYPLVQGKNIHMPEGVRRDQFMSWIMSLADKQSPDWLGLPNNAETVLLTNLGKSVIVKLLKMQQLDEDEELAYDQDHTETKHKKSDGRPSWMRTLSETVSNWLNNMPKNLATTKRTVENIKDPLYRFFEREVNLGVKILAKVRMDLQDIWMICRGEKKQTNDHRSLVSDLNRGIIPKSWVLYKFR
jgi:dynein heavy chain 1